MEALRAVRTRVAALLLAAATVVIVVAPILLDAPNPFALPAVLVHAGASGAAVFGGNRGRTGALVVSVAGLLLTVLWAWAAASGFGKGSPWWDDLIEASVLAVLFLLAAVL